MNEISEEFGFDAGFANQHGRFSKLSKGTEIDAKTKGTLRPSDVNLIQKSRESDED